MSNIVPFGPPGREVTVHDVDGDGAPDRITPGPGTDLAPVDDAPVVPVDPRPVTPTVYASLTARRDADRAPVLPAWARSAAELRSVARWVAGYYAHITAFHVVRVPLYVVKALARAPRGIGRGLARLTGWVADAEAAPLRREAVHRNDPATYMRLAELRADRSRWRAWLAGLALLAVAAAGVATAVWVPTWGQVLAAGVAVVVLARLGTDPDAPLTGRAVTVFAAPKLTSAMVTRALGALGIAGITQALAKGGDGIEFPAPITRDGDGWRADVDLPHGVTALEVCERRERLASGLRRPSGCVWPEAAKDVHDGRLVLWVGDQPFSLARQPMWPLAKTGTYDIFKPAPYGFDQRGRLVSIPLMFSSVLVGAIPRQGKTFCVRVLVLAAALDVTVELHVHELKGTGDLSAVQSIAHRYTSGPARDEDLAAVMTSLREVAGYLEARALTLARLPRHLVPENKVTREVSDRDGLGLHPVLVVVDECQELFESEYAAEAEKLCKAIIKRGPAMGVILILATQRPDKDALPKSISANMGGRLCLMVMSYAENDMILGTGMYKAGIRATTLTEDDKGVAYYREGATAKVVRSAYIDGPAADRIGARAHQIREAAGRLTGDAIGQAAVVITVSVVDDVRHVFAGDETALQNETILGRLRELRPGHYDTWQPAQLTAALKAEGVDAGRQVERYDETAGKRVNRRGVFLDDLPKAIEAAPDTPRDGADD